VCTGTGASGWNGFGYTVNHFADTYSSSAKDATGGTFGPVFVGRHHAIYQYAFTQTIAGQAVPVTIHWMFASGRSNPVFAVTYDVSKTAAGSVVADTRTPYGDLHWDGDEQATTVVAGVGWGDRYRFVTTKAPLTMNSDWDYSKPNTVPHAFEWTSAPDAEMGLVQTEPYTRHDAGGYWNFSNWGKTSANQVRVDGQAGTMPITWNWTYQLDQYELCVDTASCVDSPTGSHRVAWGANYGAIGGDKDGAPGTYAAYGSDRRVLGFPYQSYSVFVVLGQHSEATVARQVTTTETVAGTQLVATVGTISTRAPGGVGRTDTTVLEPVGYDARYAVWAATAADGVLAFTAQVGSGRLETPVIVVSGYSSAEAPTVTIAGHKATPDVDYYASVDTKTKSAWVTFPAGWSGNQTVEIR
jgi:hypothetical protein